MKRGAVQALDASGYAMRFADRCRETFGDFESPAVAVPVDESGVEQHDLVRETTGCHLSVSEIFVQALPETWKSQDYLGVLAVAFDEHMPVSSRSARVFFLGPSLLRSSGLLSSVGAVVTDIPITALPCNVADVRELSVSLYRLGTTSRTQRSLETIESLILALDYARDSLGSMTLAESILDRVMILAGLPNSGPLVRSKYSATTDTPLSAQGLYIAAQKLTSTDPEQPLIVKKNRLHAGAPLRPGGPRISRSLRELAADAIPLRLRDFVLVRIGPPVHQPAPTRTIYQLRRERALAASAGLVPDSPNADERTYLDRETRLRTLRQLAAYFGSESAQRVPAVTPIAIEVGRDLITAVESAPNTLSRECQDALNLMKDGIKYELGIEIPGVRIRGNESDLPARTYIIMIHEIPLVSGTVPADRLLCNATVDELKSIGITAEEAVNPANGSECGWIAKEDAGRAKAEGKRLRKEGLNLWKDVEYVAALHLSSVVRKNAAEFVTIKTVADLMRAKDKSAYPRIRSAPGGLPRLTMVLRILVEEEVPIKEVSVLCGRYLELAQAGAAMPQIVEELRYLPEIRPALRGNQDEVHVFKLGEKFVKSIHEGITERGEVALLALEPGLTQEALTAVRNRVNALRPSDPNPFILVEESRLRRHVRKLVELEFPHLRVLSRRELEDVTNIETTGVIEID